MSDISTRFLNKSDLTQLRNFFKIYNEENNPDSHINIKALAHEVKLDNQRKYIGAFTDGKLSGIASIDITIVMINSVMKEDFLLGDVYVLPDMRNKGIGTKLVDSVFDEAENRRENGRIWVNINDHTYGFFERLNFSRKGKYAAVAAFRTREKECEHIRVDVVKEDEPVNEDDMEK